MKNLLIVTALVLSNSAFADVAKKPAESKRVCIQVYDAKQKKDIEKCKKLKMHKKHNGTKVPTK